MKSNVKQSTEKIKKTDADSAKRGSKVVTRECRREDAAEDSALAA